jgi:hypothetical protein
MVKCGEVVRVVEKFVGLDGSEAVDGFMLTEQDLT